MSAFWPKADCASPLHMSAIGGKADICRTDHMERVIGILAQTGVMPANFTTLPHFSVSSARSLLKSEGEPGSVEAPSSANRACDLGSARIAFTALLTLSMASPAVRFGAPKPYHALAS